MATILDLGLIQSFDIVYAWLFVFAVTWAILEKTQAVGKDAKLINAIIAFAMATMFMLSSTAVAVINYIIPWFVVAIIFFLLMLLIFQMFGADGEIIKKAMQDKSLYWTIIGIGLVIIVAGFGNVLGQSLLDQSQGVNTNTNNYQGSTYTNSDQNYSNTNVNGQTVSQNTNFNNNIYATLFHPKVLAMLVLFGIAIFAIALLTG